MTERTGQQFGDYRLVRLLGKGGFADTYLGEHIHLKSFVAVKVLQTRLGQLEIEAFRNEARIVARLNHPHIIHVSEFEVENQTPYIIMEYAPNGTLRQRCPRGNILATTTILSYIKQVAAALQYAHQQKLIHRDVKPENMLLGQDGKVLLSDFGVAIIAQTQAQNLENIAGTVTYMAPEQIQGKPRPASDQYALGITAYEWLCGAPPFGGTYSEIALQHECLSPLSLREQIPTVPVAVEEVIFTALAKDPRQRFPSVENFAAALEEAYKDLPFNEYPLTIVNADPQLYVPTEVAPPPPPQTASIAVEEILSTPKRHPSSLWPLVHLSNKQGASDALSHSGKVALATPQPSSPYHSEALVPFPGSISYQTPPGWQLIPPGSYLPPTIARNAARPYRRHTSIGAALLLFSLTILIITGSAFLYSFSSYQANLLHMQATAVAGASIISTVQARTAAPGQAATAGRPHINAAIATRTALQNIYTLASSGPPTLDDSLAAPDDFGWNNTSQIGMSGRYMGNCQFTNNAYHAEALPGYLINCMAAQTHFSNILYQTDMTITSGYSGGLVLRADANGSGYYFCVSINSTYFLEKMVSNGYRNFGHTLLASGNNQAIKKGHNSTNQLAVVAQGKNLYLYVNKQYIDGTSDASYASGQIGVYARGNNYKTAITFRNAQVWKLSYGAGN